MARPGLPWSGESRVTYLAIGQPVLLEVVDELEDLVHVDVADRGRVVEELHSPLRRHRFLLLVRVELHLEGLQNLLGAGQYRRATGHRVDQRQLTLAGHGGKKRIFAQTISSLVKRMTLDGCGLADLEGVLFPDSLDTEALPESLAPFLAGIFFLILITWQLIKISPLDTLPRACLGPSEGDL